MSDRWLSAWGLASVGLGGASLVVPLYVVELGGTAFTLGVLAAAAAFAGAPGALAFGLLADRTGKRRLLVLVALALVAAMLAVIPAVESIAVVVVANAVIWFAFAAALPVLTLLAVVDVPEPAWSDRIATLNKYQGIGWAFGLFVGFVVVVGASRTVSALTAQRVFVYLCAASAGTGLVAAARWLPADPAPGAEPSPRRLRRALRSAARFNVRGAAAPATTFRVDLRRLHPRTFVDRFTPTLATFFAAVCLVFAGFGAFFAPLPAYLTTTGYTPAETFGLYLVLNTAAAAAFGTAATVAERYAVTLVHLGGLGVRGVALPVVAIVGAVFGVTTVGVTVTVAVFVVLGLTWAVIAVTAGTLVTRLSPAVVRGEALGAYSALSAVAGGVGSVLGGWLATEGYVLAFGVAGGLVFAGAVVVAVLHYRVTAAPAGTESPS